MTLKKVVYCLAGVMILIGFPHQSVCFGKLGKKHGKNSDCATGSVASGHTGGCASEGCCGGACQGGGCCFGDGSGLEIVEGMGGEFPFTEIEPNAIYLTVNLPEKSLDRPEEAILTVNGDPTKTEGASRRFIIRDLEYGKEYEFQVAAVIKNRAGVELMQKESVTLRVGDMHTMTLKPIRRKRDIEKEEAEAAAKAAGGNSADSDDENSEADSPDQGSEPEEVDAAEPVAMAFPFSLD